jgi:hypothetical protein
MVLQSSRVSTASSFQSLEVALEGIIDVTLDLLGLRSVFWQKGS